MNITNSFRYLVFLGLISLLTACGGGDSDANSPLAGAWYGTLEDSSSVMHTLSVNISSNNTISSILIDNVNQNLTGAITAQASTIGSKLYGFVLSDATEGGFFTDSTHSYIAYLADDFSFGVLQKGATSLPGYISTDIAGNWSGYSVELDSAWDLSDEYTSTATVQTDGSFSVTASGTISTGTFTRYDPTYGRYTGSYSNPPVTGDVSAFISVDKQFVASWACSGSWPSSCSYSSWTK